MVRLKKRNPVFRDRKAG